MSVALKDVNGVESVNVSLEKGLAVVTLKPGNTATVRQIENAITKNGFTMKDANAIVFGKLVESSGRLSLQVSGSNDLFTLQPNGKAKTNAPLGKLVKVVGVIPEAAKGKTPDVIRYNSMEIQE